MAERHNKKVHEEAKKVQDLVVKSITPFAAIERTSLHGHAISRVAFRSADVEVVWYKSPPVKFLSAIEEPNVGSPWLRIVLPDEHEIAIGVNVSAFAQTTGLSRGQTRFATTREVEDAVDEALWRVAKDVEMRTLAGIAEKISRREKGGFSALNKLQSLRNELNL